MKKPAAIFTTLLLLGAIVAYFLSAPLSPVHTSEPTTQRNKTLKESTQSILVRDSPLILQEPNEKPGEHALRAYAKTSSKTEKLKLEGIMRFREPRIRELLKLHQVDAETVGTVLLFIQEREAMLMNRRRTFLTSGMGAASEYRLDKKIDESLSELQLEKVLGVELARKLKDLEKKIDAEYLAKARAEISGD